VCVCGGGGDKEGRAPYLHPRPAATVANIVLSVNPELEQPITQRLYVISDVFDALRELDRVRKQVAIGSLQCCVTSSVWWRNSWLALQVESPSAFGQNSKRQSVKRNRTRGMRLGTRMLASSQRLCDLIHLAASSAKSCPKTSSVHDVLDSTRSRFLHGVTQFTVSVWRNVQCQPVRKWTPERNPIGHTFAVLEARRRGIQ
jgi:hypothetical protein